MKLLAQPTTSVAAFLDGVKRGYAQRFGEAFEELGFEDVHDIAEALDDELHCRLTEGLIKLGAKLVQLAHINKALKGVTEHSDRETVNREAATVVDGGDEIDPDATDDEDEERDNDGVEDAEGSGCEQPPQQLENLLDEQQPAAPYPPNGRDSFKNSFNISSEEAAVQHADCGQEQGPSGSGGGDSCGVPGVVGGALDGGDGVVDAESDGYEPPPQQQEVSLFEQQPAAPYPPNGRDSFKNSFNISSEEAAVQHADCGQGQRPFGSDGGDSRGAPGVVGDAGAHRGKRGCGKKKRGGRRRAVAAKRAIVRERRDYAAIHARFLKNLSKALTQELYYDPEVDDPEGDDRDMTPKQRIVTWAEFFEWERLEKGIDLTRDERAYFKSAPAGGGAAAEFGGDVIEVRGV